MSETTENTRRHTRAGTAQRNDGKATATKIVNAAYKLLQTGGAADFSMRNVADRAGIRLANLQYYYPKKEDLIRALMAHVGEIYNARYKKHLAAVENSPASRLKAAIELNLKDIVNPETRHFFIQFWPLLGVADNYSGELLSHFYAPQKRQLATLIAELNPALTSEDVTRRAELITATFEGLMVTANFDQADSEDLIALIFQQILTIANNPPLESNA